MTHVEPNRLQHMHRYWRAANYLTVGQIYVQENPLLREPLCNTPTRRMCLRLSA